jgi:hypothetical protein
VSLPWAPLPKQPTSPDVFTQGAPKLPAIDVDGPINPLKTLAPAASTAGKEAGANFLQNLQAQLDKAQ